MTNQAQPGDRVKVHYTGTLDDGSVFDSSRGREPIEFTLGEGQIIKGFEKAVLGMEPGQTKTAKLPADEAYGAPREELRIKVDRAVLPPDVTPEVGQTLYVKQPDGSPAPVRVAEIADESVVLDANHPLAGKDLVFEIELVDVQNGSA